MLLLLYAYLTCFIPGYPGYLAGECSLRIVLLDFSKAFDRINFNVLITKLIDVGLCRSLIPWLCDFLSNRRQRVKLGESISEWVQVNAGA